MKQSRLLLFFLFLPTIGFTQKPAISDWLNKLRDNSPEQVFKHYSIYQEVEKMDSLTRIQAANDIEKATAGENKRVRLLGRSIKAKIFFYYINEGDSVYAAHMKECLLEAIQTEDTWLQAEFGRWYSEMLNTLNKKELAVQYAVSALKLHEYLGFGHFPAVSVFYLWLGETLMQTDYLPDAIRYLKNGLELAKNDTLVKPFRYMFTYNNLGLVYRRLKKHDSALYYFNRVKEYAPLAQRPDWADIAYQNRTPSMVELGMLDSATIISNWIIQQSKINHNTDNEMYGIEMLGQIEIRRKNYEAAIAYLLKSKQLNGGKNQRALGRVHEALATCYENLGQPEKAYPFLKAARHYNDSVNKARQNYNSNYLAVKGEYEKEQLRLKQLSKETHNAIFYRNTGIAVLLLLSGVGIFWLNHRRKKMQRLQVKAAAELSKFREEMISKNNQIEYLMANLQVQENKQKDARSIELLSQQMILTEADWLNFKSLFEKTYPAFFKTLREKAPGITEAEQRMAALLKIQLSTRQIAAMQGISPDSVHKTRQRLRLRFGTESTSELEAILADI